MTPYYQDSAVTIYHGDCRDILPTLAQVDPVLTDPPYGEVNRDSNGLRGLDKGVADEKTMEDAEVMRVVLLAQSPSVYIWCGTEQVSAFRSWLVAAGYSTRVCVWEKSNPSPMNGQHIWLSSIELCVYGKKANATFTEFCSSPVFRGQTANSIGHPTTKPDWLMRRAILASSNKGNEVLDPFMGSGTTLRAAKDLGRRAIGIEIEERYCEIAAKRMSQEVMDL